MKAMSVSKRCYRCGRVKLRREFGLDVSKSDRLQDQCRRCVGWRLVSRAPRLVTEGHHLLSAIRTQEAEDRSERNSAAREALRELSE